MNNNDEFGPKLRIELQRARRDAQKNGLTDAALVEWCIDRLSFSVMDLDVSAQALRFELIGHATQQDALMGRVVAAIFDRMEKIEATVWAYNLATGGASEMNPCRTHRGADFLRWRTKSGAWHGACFVCCHKVGTPAYRQRMRETLYQRKKTKRKKTKRKKGGGQNETQQTAH